MLVRGIAILIVVASLGLTASAQQVNVGMDARIARLSDDYSKLTLAGAGLTIEYAPSSEWTLALEQTFLQVVSSDYGLSVGPRDDFRLLRPMLSAMFLPESGLGARIGLAPPIVDGATVFDRNNPDVSADAVLSIQADPIVAVRLQLGYGYQFSNPDSECFGSLSDRHTLRAKVVTVVSNGRWTLLPHLEARHGTGRSFPAYFAGVRGAVRIIDGISITMSGDLGFLPDNAPQIITGTLGFVQHFGTLRAFAADGNVAPPQRLTTPIAHCS